MVGKVIKNKTIKKEDLPSRMAKATITAGDLHQRMGNYYKKSPNPGADAKASPLILFTAAGRMMGMA